MSTPFINRAWWIWSAEGTHAAPPPELSSGTHYEVRMFRRPFVVRSRADAALTVYVSADSRYVLFCNGALVGRGPAKGDVVHHFYETYDLTAHLRDGANCLAALVCDMSIVAPRPTHLGAPCSVMTYAGGFLLEGEVIDRPRGTVDRLDTGLGGWRVAVARAYRFQNDGTKFEGYHGFFEHRVSSVEPANWTAAEFDDTAWPEASAQFLAERLENRRDPTSPYGLVPRMIPPLEEGEPEMFADAFLPGGIDPGAAWQALRAGEGTVEIGPRECVQVMFDVGKLTTAYPSVRVRGGAGATLRLTYAEALRLPWNTPGARLLGRPQPLANLASHYADETTGWTFDRRGEISGWSDVWEPAGRPDGESFVPLHWRTFRYVGLTIKTADEPLVLEALQHRFTAYPYRVAADFRSDDERLENIWRVGLRTMRLCAHETFEDCPYYEQMQYAGDTMITSKLGMLTTGDARLSRQALYQFDWSRLPDGVTQSRYPSRLLQVIPSWSLHWITSIHDYTWFSGDLTTTRDLMPGIRSVLDWFRRHGDADGLPARLPYWNITDWCPWWHRGVVPGAAEGPTCIIAAQYIVALTEAADLFRLIDQGREADELEAEADTLRARLHARFWSEAEGLYYDRPGGPETSQYGNAWAVICGAAGRAEHARLRQRFPRDPKLAPVSFFGWHAVFRALAMMGDYDQMPRLLGPWFEMVDLGLSTFAEENSFWRSLCHAWSAHPLLEFLTRILGVSPARPGFAAIAVRPHLCGLTFAEGRVCTPRGFVDVAWRRAEQRLHLEITAPSDTPVHVTMPGGATSRFNGGHFTEKFVLP